MHLFVVIEGDYAVCMQHLMRFPAVYEVNYLVQRALHLRNPVRVLGYYLAIWASCPKKKKKKNLVLYFSKKAVNVITHC